MPTKGVISIRLGEELVEKVGRLVKRKAFKDKSEAIRKILSDHLMEHPEFFSSEDLKAIVKEAEAMSDKEFDKLAKEVFAGRKTAAEIVAEGRERF